MKCDMAGAAAVVAGHVRDRRARAAGQGDDVRADGREHGVRRRDPARRRAHDVRRHDRRGAQHRRRGPAGPGRRAGPRDRAEARRDHRRRHPDRPHGARARRPGRRRAWATTTIVDAVLAAGRDRRRGAVADADPRGDDRADPQQQDRRPGPARLDPLGRRPVRRRRSCASSPAGCRGPTSTSPGRRSTPAAPTATSPPGGTGFAVATLVDYARRSPTAVEPTRLEAAVLLLAPVVVAHPLRDADHRGVVRRHAGACCRSRAPTRPTAPGAGSTRRRGRPAAGSRR